VDEVAKKPGNLYFGQEGDSALNFVNPNLNQRPIILHHNRGAYPSKDNKAQANAVSLSSPVSSPPVSAGRGTIY